MSHLSIFGLFVMFGALVATATTALTRTNYDKANLRRSFIIGAVIYRTGFLL